MICDMQRHSGLVKKTARSLYSRYATVRASHELDDLEQELWIILIRCQENFDPDFGVSFEGYFYRSAKNKVVNLSQMAMKRRAVGETVGEFAGVNMDQLVAGKGPDPEEALIALDMGRRILRDADPRMAKLVELIRDEPEPLRREAAALEAKRSYACAQGVPRNVGAGVGMSDLFYLLGVGRAQGYRLIAALKEQIEHDE